MATKQNTLTEKQFRSGYRLATIEDFKSGLTYYTTYSVMDEVGVKAVKPTSNLSADATRFQSHVLKSEAYLPKTSAAKKKSKAASTQNNTSEVSE